MPIGGHSAAERYRIVIRKTDLFGGIFVHFRHTVALAIKSEELLMYDGGAGVMDTEFDMDILLSLMCDDCKRKEYTHTYDQSTTGSNSWAELHHSRSDRRKLT